MKLGLMHFRRSCLFLLVAGLAATSWSCIDKKKSSDSSVKADLNCVFTGSNVGSAVQAASDSVLGLVGATVPGAGLLTQALAYTTSTLIGENAAQCDDTEKRFIAMEKYTREQLNQIHVRFEDEWQALTRTDLVTQQGEFRSRIFSLSLSLDYLRKAQTESEFDNQLQAAIRDFNWTKNAYESLLTNVNESKSLIYVAGVSQSLTFQGIYLAYLGALHKALIGSKSKWKLPHREDALAQIAGLSRNYGQLLFAIQARYSRPELETSISHAAQSYTPKFYDGAGNELSTRVPPTIVNGFGSTNPSPGPYMQRRSDAETAKITFLDNDAVEFQIKALGGIVVKRNLNVGGQSVDISPNPMKACMDRGINACEELKPLLEAGLRNLKEFRDANDNINKMIASMNTDLQFNTLTQIGSK